MRRRWLAASAVAVLVATIGMWTGAQAATPAPLSIPKLTAKIVNKTNVRVRWTFTGKTSTPQVTLHLERGTSPTSFAPLKDVPKAKGTRSYLDKKPGPGTWFYRARFSYSGITTEWSAPVSITVASPTTTTTTTTTTTPAAPPPGYTNCPSGSEAELETLINRDRTANGVAPLTRSSTAATAARTHSIAMATAGKLLHDTKWAGGQNIAWGWSASEVQANFMAETPPNDIHRRIIVNPNYRHIGVGCVRDSSGVRWWTENFL